ncbi:secretion protein HlyD [Pseudorhizobium halotolerans]|uniref:Secretion protein HlyD n=1 Tax=Pseudorhizobium halotolerans TaxID=1233081 RepID=A0ABM8PVT0_9HYPH|nr:HlyD family efflux transporter periplasmic adaptor subunit [Pseudorhizobium halotolerans]CAD7051231.1 secretion protein HlyD [Pseudorhizobium halotolerans]
MDTTWRDKGIVRWTIIGLLVVAFLGAAAWYVNEQNNRGLPEGFAAGNGRLEADQIDLATRLGGRVAEIRVSEGDLVHAGDVVAVMDTSELQALLSSARADAARAESQINEVRALIQQREADLALARIEFQRTGQLAERGVQSQALADRAKATLAVAEAAVEAAQAQLSTAERAVEAARALATRYETQIADSTLTAPVFGRILYRLAQPGEVIAAGGRVVTIINLTQVYMEIFLPAADTMRTPIGAEARIRLDNIDYAIPARVSFVSPEAQFTPRTVETYEERADLMFRIRVRVPEELVRTYVDHVRTGLRGVATIRLSGNDTEPWPAEFVGKPIPEDALPKAE